MSVQGMDPAKPEPSDQNRKSSILIAAEACAFVEIIFADAVGRAIAEFRQIS